MLLEGLITQVDRSTQESVMNEWLWLVGVDKQLVAITHIGDAFLSDSTGSIYWLDTGNGSVTKVSDSFFDFTESLGDSEIKDEWLLSSLVANLKESGLHRQTNQVYSYRQLPILGGEYEVSNFFCLDIVEHFSVTSRIHYQIRDLPEGAIVSLKLTD